ncbi:bacillithiol biosynthesis cysteine-adding enzyme BshC [Rapidithrix thailandica]|uniref:Putative cysteine ligase BshC n=1 Tax=Rapidithrix thailandica TaxID=413964 RepID=A0AAW9RY94_9BACT
MKNVPISFETTNQFSKIFLDYIRQAAPLHAFYNLHPKIQNFGEVLTKRTFSPEARQRLHQSLLAQYASLEESPKEQIDSLLHENTFTVTTGHQLNIFTGPLYFIYKVVTVINLAKQLKKAYPQYNFVPVYWMASEDHDFEEIKYFHLFGQRHEWQHPDPKGAVGHMDLQGLDEILNEVENLPAVFQKAYTECKTLAEAKRYYVNALFGKQGLVVVDGDDKALKRAFGPVIKDDLLNHSAKALVEKTDEALQAKGYKNQIFARDINFFYLDCQLRERIVKDNGGEGHYYEVLNKDEKLSEQELLELLETHPERFSPNVVMRPVYQETILPNIAYIGGPAEIAYWLQLKAVFDHYQVDYPLLVPRNFALVINKSSLSRLDKLGFKEGELFQEIHELKKLYLDRHSENAIELTREVEAFQQLFQNVLEKAEQVDKSLVGFVGAEEKKGLKALDNIAKRMKKSEERNQETAMSQIEKLKEKLFPNGGLQERHDNFLNFYLNDPEFIDKLLATLEPLDFRFHVLRYE